MMKSMSHSRETTSYSSVVWHDSKALSGVRYATRRISLMQRIDLTNRAREIVLKHEFFNAGDASDQLEATLGELLVRKLYIEWGVQEIEGLSVDGEAATVESIVAKGPEDLTDEIVATVRAELELSEEERKNS
jgi:hypothetical protein